MVHHFLVVKDSSIGDIVSQSVMTKLVIYLLISVTLESTLELS